MNILVIGGKLQGMEVMYLAKVAGHHVTLVDHNPNPSGRLLAHRFVQADVWDQGVMVELFAQADAVFPAIEDELALNQLEVYHMQTGTRLLYQKAAYAISQSKKASKDLFQQLQIPAAQDYPHCNYPVIVKPNNQSGSQGVCQAWTPEEVEALVGADRDAWIVEEYLEGASYSLEVIGDGTQYTTSLMTQVVFGAGYDCKRIVAPVQLTAEESAQLQSMAEKLAKHFAIAGIFDIEVINRNGTLYMLEIDARFPSQTPVAIYYATGMNLVDRLVQGDFSSPDTVKQVALYQQIQVTEEEIRVLGEHVLGTCVEMDIADDFFGAEMAITDYALDKSQWCAIMVTVGQTEQGAYKHFLTCIDAIEQKIGKRCFVETQP
ncbi:3-methylornithine--L-lysine ligase PylC [Bengtsoniella intestinalis]|uniref:3-methylornithine--L-lysine ligase PylC n=1 Tax=Bengtsoniella intestinalis TaxID=3073143 RepID=UPI00391FA4C3